MSVVRLWIVAGLTAAAMIGCGEPIRFPAVADEQAAADAESYRAYDVEGDGVADFFLFADESGRVDVIAYDRSADGLPDRPLALSDVPFGRARHLVLIVDGVGYNIAKELHDEGALRLFHPPSRVIAPYPTMTDICLAQALDSQAPLAYEAKYYDHESGRIVGGSDAYLNETNEPHLRKVHFSAATLWRALGFLFPGHMFKRELADVQKAYRDHDEREFIAYFGATAAVGTRESVAGHRDVLLRMEQLAHELLYDSGGLVKVTLMSDHGHGYVECQPVRVEAHLADKGWRLRNRLEGDRDAVWIRFGLVTFTSFATRDPAGLAADLVGCEGLDIISYTDEDRVVVLNGAGQRAVVHRSDQRYRYEPVDGDPLRLTPILATLSVDANGFVSADDLLVATADHEYPAPLQRLYEGHFAAVQNPADVVCSLTDGYFAGSGGFAGSVKVASTHGSLDRINSTAFIMSSIGPLPELMRSADIPQHMGALTGAPWPSGQ